MIKLHPKLWWLGTLLGTLILLATPSVAETTPAGWSEIRTEHFTIYSQTAAERAEEIARRLERFRATFARLAPALELRSPAPTKILAFRDKASYASYKAGREGAGALVLGQFLSHSDGNYLTLDASTERVGAFAVIQHEFVHYFARHNFPAMPLWLNEGLAEYYSTFESQGHEVVIGEHVERHVRWLTRASDLGLAEVLTATSASQQGHGGQETGRLYAVSWALVHFLLSKDDRVEQLADYLFLLQEGEDSDAAFEEAFELRLSSLEEELAAYVRAGEFPTARLEVGGSESGLRVTAARPAEIAFHLGDLLAHIGRSRAAEQHFQMALDLEPQHPETLAGLAALRSHAGRYEEAEWLFHDALEIGSDDPLTYLLFGRHNLKLLHAGEAPDLDGDGEGPRPGELAERARAAFEHAADLLPSYAEAWTLLGAAHQLGAENPDRSGPAPAGRPVSATILAASAQSASGRRARPRRLPHAAGLPSRSRSRRAKPGMAARAHGQYLPVAHFPYQRSPRL